MADFATIPFRYRPIDDWPGETTKKRRKATFQRGWASTLRLITRELGHLEAVNVVCQVALREKDFRLTDGHPRAQARAEHPGVILAFESKFGPLKYATDVFDDFTDNFLAIALSLEHLRLVDRYGVSARGEQYRGWQQLGPGTIMGAPMSRDEAERVLRDLADLLDDWTFDTPADIDRAYRRAVKFTHPDQGGNAEMFRAATASRDRLLELVG